MRLLVDAHALLWGWANDPQSSESARTVMIDESKEVNFSAASAWEIAGKQRIGKQPMSPMRSGAFNELAAADGFVHVPVRAAHAWRAVTWIRCTVIPSTACWPPRPCWTVGRASRATRHLPICRCPRFGKPRQGIRML